MSPSTVRPTTPARVAGRLLDLAFPARCAGCGEEGEAICSRCAHVLDVRLAQPPGIPLGLPSTVPPPLLQLEWCAAFTGAVRAALHALKYAGERRLADPLGRSLASRWRAAGAGGDILVPVPVHTSRARERGYDQADLLARAAARHLSMPVTAGLERHRATVAQFRLDRPARAANVRGAFGPGAGVRCVRGRWVVLVDDVATTGATLAACARVLLDHGAIGVSAVTVARER